jgi:phage-related protein
VADMNLGVLVVDVAANLAEFEKEIDKAKTTLEGWGKQIAPATAAMGAAFVGLAGSIAYAVKSFSDAHEAQIRLATALQATGQAVNVAPFNELASAIQATTGFEDDAAIAASAMMARFGLLEGQISSLLPSVADFAAFMGTDLPDAANQIGRAVVTGTVGPLVRAGIAFDDASKAAFENASISERVAIAHDKLANSVGGAATALAGTAGGALSQLRNAFGDVAETVGSAFEPIVVSALQSVTSALQTFNGWLSQLSPTMKGIGVVAAGAALAFTGISATWGTAILILPKLITLLKSLATMLAGVGASAAVATVAIVAVAAAGIALGDMVKASGGTAEGFFSDLPLIAKGAALGVLDSLETIFGMAPGTIENALGKATDKIKGWASDALSAIGSLGSSLGSALSGALSGLGDLFGGAGSSIADFFASAFDAIMGAVPSSITSALTSALASVQEFAANVWTTMKEVGASIVNSIIESLGVVGRAIKEFAGAIGDIFGTAGKYWGDKLSGLVGGGAPAAAGGAAGGAPAAGGSADVVQNQLGKLADELSKFANSLAASSNESKVLAPLMKQFNAAMKGGLSPQEATAFSKSLTAAGVSMEQFKGYIGKVNAAYAEAIKATQDYAKEVIRGTRDQSAAAALVGDFRKALSGGFSTREAATFNAELRGAGVSLEDFKKSLDAVTAVEDSLARLKLKLGQDEAAQVQYFADTLRGLLQFGGSSEDLAAFSGEVTKAGISLATIEDAAAKAAQAEKEMGWFNQFKAAAHEATTTWLATFTDTMLVEANGATTILGDAYNLAVDIFGGNLVEGAINASTQIAGKLGEAAGNFAKGFGNTISSKLGEFGGLIQTAFNAFKSGGPWAAVGAVIAELMSKTPEFQDALKQLSEGVMNLAKHMRPLVSAIMPLVGVILEVLGAIGSLLGILITALKPATMAVVKMIGDIVTAILTFLLPIFNLLGNVFAAIAPIIKALAEIIGNVLTKVFSLLGRVLRPIVTVITAILVPILTVVATLLQVLSTLISVVLQVLGPILIPLFDALGGIFQALARVVAAVMWVVLGVLRAIGEIWNGIIWAIQSVFYSLGEIEVFGKKPLGFLSDWADSLESAKANTDGLAEQMGNLQQIMATGTAPAAETDAEALAAFGDGVTSAGDGAGEAASKFGEAADKATEQLTNVPQGFKVAAERFAAATPEPQDAGGGVAGGSNGGTTNIGNVTIVSDDPEKIWAGIKKIIAWENFAGTGTPVASGAAYSTPSTGG